MTTRAHDPASDGRFPPMAFERARPVQPRFEYSDRVQAMNLDAVLLSEELLRSIKGEVRFDDGSRALYATDASNYRQVPIGVVVPRDVEALVTATALCR